MGKYLDSVIKQTKEGRKNKEKEAQERLDQVVDFLKDEVHESAKHGEDFCKATIGKSTDLIPQLIQYFTKEGFEIYVEDLMNSLDEFEVVLRWRI